MSARPMPVLRTRSTSRSLVAVTLTIGLLSTFASAVAWAEWEEVEAAFGGTGREAFDDAERRPRSPTTVAVEEPSREGDDRSTGGAEPEVAGGSELADADAVAPAEAEGPDGAPAPPPTSADAVTASADPAGTAHRRVARALDQWLAHHPEVVSVALAVISGGPDGMRWSGASGDPSRRLDHAARYPIMSVTKTFTEALVLRQAAAGAIDLDAPMPALPDVAPVPEGVVITPRMLLQHTSGLVNYMDATGYDPAAAMTPAKAVSLSVATPLLAEPGTRTHYSNSNFHWLGLLLEHTTGRPFDALVGDLAREFGLTSAAVSAPARPGWVGFASGGMGATLDDVATWGSHLFTPGSVLAPADLTAYRAVGPLGVGLGIWPICPCTTAADGSVDYTAIGQIVADGGLLYFPAGDVVVAVRLAAVPGDVGTVTASVAGAVRAAFADRRPARVR